MNGQNTSTSTKEQIKATASELLHNTEEVYARVFLPPLVFEPEKVKENLRSAKVKLKELLELW